MDRKHKLDLGDIEASDKKSKQDAQYNPWTGLAYSARYFSILESRTKLPVYAFKQELIDAVRENQIVIVEGETGSGKSLALVGRRSEAASANTEHGVPSRGSLASVTEHFAPCSSVVNNFIVKFTQHPS